METGWNYVIQNWAETYFTTPLMLIALLIAIASGILYAKKDIVSLSLILYLIIYFAYLLISTVDLVTNRSKLNLESINYNYDNFFLFAAAVEVLAFSIFFISSIKSKRSKYLIKYTSLLYLTCFVIYYMIQFFDMNHEKYFKYYHLFATIQLLIFCVYSFIYFYEALLLNTPNIKLTSRPSFWITSATLLVCIIRIPVHPIEKSLELNYHQLSIIIYLIQTFAYFLLIFALTNGFLCKKKIST